MSERVGKDYEASPARIQTVEFGWPTGVVRETNGDLRTHFLSGDQLALDLNKLVSEGSIVLVLPTEPVGGFQIEGTNATHVPGDVES